MVPFECVFTWLRICGWIHRILEGLSCTWADLPMGSGLVGPKTVVSDLDKNWVQYGVFPKRLECSGLSGEHLYDFVFLFKVWSSVWWRISPARAYPPTGSGVVYPKTFLRAPGKKCAQYEVVSESLEGFIRWIRFSLIWGFCLKPNLQFGEGYRQPEHIHPRDLGIVTPKPFLGHQTRSVCNTRWFPEVWNALSGGSDFQWFCVFKLFTTSLVQGYRHWRKSIHGI